ncbi:PadR family transcriptional regulator [Nocardia arthritidis]|nr:PadR family transcriptional regulator [Nocardia arthritidis]
MGQQERNAVTPLAIAVLGLLEERPMHPYEMYQLLVSRQQNVLVKVRPGSLYHTVARLADLELVRAEGTGREGNRPERTTYRITERGRTAMRERIAEILRAPAAEYPAFPIGIAEAHNLPMPEVIALLNERLELLHRELAEIDIAGDWAGSRGVPRRYWLVLPYLRAMLTAEIAWVDEFLADLTSGAMEWEQFDATTGDRHGEPCDGHSSKAG